METVESFLGTARLPFVVDKEWVPFFQTLVWPLIILVIFLLAKKQIDYLVKTLADAISYAVRKRLSKISYDGISFEEFPQVEEPQASEKEKQIEGPHH